MGLFNIAKKNKIVAAEEKCLSTSSRCLSYSVRDGYITNLSKLSPSTLIDALARWTADALNSAPLDHYNSAGEIIENSPILELINNPAPELGISWDQILYKIALDLKLTGNSWLLIIRDMAGDPVRLIPKGKLTPNFENNVLVSWYDQHGTYPSENIIHFAIGLEGCLGKIPEAIDLHIKMDREIDLYTRDILVNQNTMGLIVTVPGNPTKADMEQMKDTLNNSFGPGSRGGTAIFPEGTDVQFIGNKPSDLDISSMTDRMEERICAVWGVPALVIGLHQKDAKFSNLEQARKLAFEACLVPLWNNIAKTLSKKLLSSEYLKYDQTKSPHYEVVAKEQAQQVSILWRSGIITRGEARAMLGLSSSDQDDTYISAPSNSMELNQNNIAPSPEEA